MFRQGRVADAIPFFEKATAVMETDWHNPAMLMTCYQGAKDTEQLRRVARITIDRVEKAHLEGPFKRAGALDWSVCACHPRRG